jgi:polyribonucleotide 5'-hydroxyl-kinase
VRAYFFGRAALYTPSGPPSGLTPLASSLAASLSPHTLFVPASALALYRPARPDEDAAVPLALLPGDADLDARAAAAAAAKSAPLEKVAMEPPPGELQGAVLAVMQAAPGTSVAEVASSSVMGFLYVAEVDAERGRLRVLSPMGGKVPWKAMVWGGVEMEGLAGVMG